MDHKCRCSTGAFLYRLGAWGVRLFIAFAVMYVGTLTAIAAHYIAVVPQ